MATFSSFSFLLPFIMIFHSSRSFQFIAKYIIIFGRGLCVTKLPFSTSFHWLNFLYYSTSLLCFHAIPLFFHCYIRCAVCASVNHFFRNYFSVSTRFSSIIFCLVLLFGHLLTKCIPTFFPSIFDDHFADRFFYNLFMFIKNLA